MLKQRLALIPKYSNEKEDLHDKQQIDRLIDGILRVQFVWSRVEIELIIMKMKMCMIHNRKFDRLILYGQVER